MVDVDIEFNLPTDDFYLQWSHIFWWKFRFDMLVKLQEELKKDEGLRNI